MKDKAFLYSMLEQCSILSKFLLDRAFSIFQKFRAIQEQKNWSALNRTTFKALKTQNFKKLYKIYIKI